MIRAEPKSPHSPIRRLDEETVSRIAAGEVVERPASVVKELIENALDAGATSIGVSIRGGGSQQILVEDDGIGIPGSELELALERHATSKLVSGSDLQGILTLGFRGEALNSIAAVACVEIVSRTRVAEEARSITVEFGRGARQSVRARALGTTVCVERLFERTPARKKFLKSPVSESIEIHRVVERMHLARPEVALRLESESKEVANFPSARSLRDAVGQVFGAEFLAQSFGWEGSLGPGVRAEAVLSRPSLSRGDSYGLQFVVDGRPVQAPALGQAVRRAYRDHLPRARFPIGVVRLTVDPSQIDVNVHPTKREVRIARETDLANLLAHEIRRALGSTPPFATPLGDAPERGGSASTPTSLEERRASSQLSALSLPMIPVLARQRRLWEPATSAVVPNSPTRPALRLLGAVFRLYWIGETEEQLILIDQHAASERLLFESLLQSGRLSRQALVEPIRLNLSPRQREVLRSEDSRVREAGFVVEPFGGDQYRVTAVPSYRGRLVPAENLVELLDEVAAGVRPTIPDGPFERRAASIACHTAVRAGDTISTAEMSGILQDLDRLPRSVYSCPHGRPIMVELDRARIDRMFLRPSG